jgi:hypothetical protein
MENISEGISIIKTVDRKIIFRFRRGAARLEEVVVTKTPIFSGHRDGFT